MRTDKKSAKKSPLAGKGKWLLAVLAGVGAAVLVSTVAVTQLGPSPFRKAVGGVEAERLAAEGQQILMAKRAFEAAGKKAKSLQDLQGSGALPPDWVDGPDFQSALRAKVAIQVCVAINQAAKLNMGKRVVLNVKDAAKEQTASFGCLTADNTVFQKF